jgi:hypothetical protein
MSKIHNMIRTIGQPGSEEFDLPAGWEVSNVVVLGQTTPDEQSQIGAGWKILYVLVPIVDEVRSVAAKLGRPPKNE